MACTGSPNFWWHILKREVSATHLCKLVSKLINELYINIYSYIQVTICNCSSVVAAAQLPRQQMPTNTVIAVNVEHKTNRDICPTSLPADRS